jgi:hypothetical protein
VIDKNHLNSDSWIIFLMKKVSNCSDHTPEYDRFEGEPLMVSSCLLCLMIFFKSPKLLDHDRDSEPWQAKSSRELEQKLATFTAAKHYLH